MLGIIETLHELARHMRNHTESMTISFDVPTQMFTVAFRKPNKPDIYSAQSRDIIAAFAEATSSNPL
jgi:hypothetical protein